MPDSAERFHVRPHGQGFEKVPRPDGDYVTYEDHQHLLQAEVEKREEATKERESLVGELATLLGPQKPRPGVTQNDQFIAAVTQLLREKEAAESRLSSVEEGLKKQRDQEWAESRDDSVAPDVQMRCHVRATAYDYALQLLRDKGTEQGESR